MVGVGTNLRPRESTLHSAEERVCPERLMTVLGGCIVVLWGGCGCCLEEGTMEGGSWYVKGSKGVVG